MTHPGHDRSPGLGEFLDVLRFRLRALAPDEVMAALISHAVKLPPQARQGFLNIFPEQRRPVAVRLDNSRQAGPDPENLLADVDTFVERARGGEFDEREELYEDSYSGSSYDWYDSGTSTVWGSQADALFTAVTDAFRAGHLELARNAYGQLLPLFTPVSHGGAGLSTGALTIDVGEAMACYLRAVYETTPPQTRGAALYLEYLRVCAGTQDIGLGDIIQAGRGDLPDHSVFLPAWVEALLGGAVAGEATDQHRPGDGQQPATVPGDSATIPAGAGGAQPVDPATGPTGAVPADAGTAAAGPADAGRAIGRASVAVPGQSRPETTPMSPEAQYAAGMSPSVRRRLMVEAALWHEGIDGLAKLARRPGSHQPGTYLSLIDELTNAGRLAEAAHAAREACTLTTATPASRAMTADRLAELTIRLDDLPAATDARRDAWQTAPTRNRLLALVETAEAAGSLAETLAAEADRTGPDPDRLAAGLLLLAGRGDAAAAALARVSPMGWSRPEHAGPVLLPYLLAAATGTTPPPAEAGPLGGAFAALDTALPQRPRIGVAGDSTEYTHITDDLRDFCDAATGLPGADDAPHTIPGGGRHPAPGATRSLVARLTRQLTEQPAEEQHRRRWLATAAVAIEQHVDAAVRGKHRAAYGRAAYLVVAYAEALALTGSANGHGYIAGIQQRYSRNTALHAELERATRTSALLTEAAQR